MNKLFRYIRKRRKAIGVLGLVFVVTLIFTVPLFPYIGFLPLFGAGASVETLLPLLLVYCLAAAVFGIYLYRIRNA